MERLHDGLISKRLRHVRSRCYLLPHALVGFRGTRFFPPSFFGPPQLVFDVPSTGSRLGPFHYEVTLDLDIATPRAAVATRVVVRFRSDGWVRSCNDGAQLYRCTYREPLAARLADQVAGDFQALVDGYSAIGVYYHPTPANAGLIA